jgi:hypothetical protein
MGGEEVQLLLILNLGTRWGWVVSITPQPRFTPGERTAGTYCTGSWVGPRAGPGAETRGKTLCLCRGSNPSRPARSQPLYRLSCRSSGIPCNQFYEKWSIGRNVIGETHKYTNTFTQTWWCQSFAFLNKTKLKEIVNQFILKIILNDYFHTLSRSWHFFC